METVSVGDTVQFRGETFRITDIHRIEAVAVDGHCVGSCCTGRYIFAGRTPELRVAVFTAHPSELTTTAGHAAATG